MCHCMFWCPCSCVLVCVLVCVSVCILCMSRCVCVCVLGGVCVCCKNRGKDKPTSGNRKLGEHINQERLCSVCLFSMKMLAGPIQ